MYTRASFRLTHRPYDSRRFLFGTTLVHEDLAFSQPTALGRRLARAFFQSDVYNVYLEQAHAHDGAESCVATAASPAQRKGRHDHGDTCAAIDDL